jgi:hypothetical protein
LVRYVCKMSSSIDDKCDCGDGLATGSGFWNLSGLGNGMFGSVIAEVHGFRK